MREELWSKFDVADKLGLSPKGADNWLRRYRDRVPIAGRSEPVRGGSMNLYRAADVLAAREASPGRGNHRPRKLQESEDGEKPRPAGRTVRRGGLDPKHREILETLAVQIEQYGHENAYVEPVKKPSNPNEFSTYTITAMVRRGLLVRETLTSVLSMGERNGRTKMSVAFMTATGRRALEIDDYPEIPADGPGDERVILVRRALDDARQAGALPADAVVEINALAGVTSMIEVHVDIEGGRHLPRESARPLASTLHDLIGHRRKVDVYLNSRPVESYLG